LFVTWGKGTFFHGYEWFEPFLSKLLKGSLLGHLGLWGEKCLSNWCQNKIMIAKERWFKRIRSTYICKIDMLFFFPIYILWLG
jgi:hypothetical protein